MKKDLKKLFLLLIVTVLVITLAGCGKSKNNENNEEEISAGVWNGNVYTNEFLDIKYTIPEGWTYSSKEELADLMNISLDFVSDITNNSEYKKELAKQVTVYYLTASNPNTGDNVQVVSEKTVMDVTEEYYINNLTEQFTKMEAIKYEILDSSSEKLGKYDYKTITIKASDYNIYQRVYVRKSGKYIINIIITSTKGLDSLKEMANSFE